MERFHGRWERNEKELMSLLVANKTDFAGVGAGTGSERAGLGRPPQSGLVLRQGDRRGTRNKFQDLDPVEDLQLVE